ncbi:MAG: hypothetical protein HC796_09380 [Synechococcaceae cyanobacterium RL_1_2]|nr:hypothetical protein [Synechococcaceae cyanobacterium RL_1_2]
MGLNKISWGLITSALMVTTGVIAYEYWPDPVPTAADQSVIQTLHFDQGAIERITIARGSDRLELVPTGDSLQPWDLIHQGQQQPANTAAVSYLLNLFAEPDQGRMIEITAEQRQLYGLTTPIAVLTIATTSGLHTINLGKDTFNNQSLYAEIDPQPDQLPQVAILKVDWRNAVLRPTEQWIGQTVAPSPQKP